MGPRTACVAWASSLLLLLLLPGAAAAAAELPRSGTLTGNALAAGPDGHVAAIFEDDGPIRVRSADPGGQLGPPVTIAPDGGSFATVAVGPGGAALAEWDSGGPDGVLMTSYRPPGGAFAPPERLSDGRPGGEQWAVADFDAAGDATIAWAAPDPKDQLLVRTRAVDGTWGAPEAIAAHLPFRPELSVAPSGTTTLTWQEAGGPKDDTSRVKVATRPPGATFGAPQTLAGSGRRAGEPVVSANERGDAVVAWVEVRERADDAVFSVHAAFRAAGSDRFGRAVAITRQRDDAAFPSVSVDPTGRMVLAATGDGPGPRRAWARIRTRAGKLLDIHVLTNDHEGGSNVVALASGRGIVAWFDRDPGKTSLRTATATPGGGFDPPVLRATTRELGALPWLFATPTGLLTVTPAGRILTF